MELDTIACGDCLAIMKDMPDGCVDLVIADLPYKDGEGDGAWGSNISLEIMWKSLYRISKHNAVFVFFAQAPFLFRLGCSNIKHFRHDWTWVKDKSANFLAAPYMPLKITEQILVFSQCGFPHNSKNKCTYNPKMVVGKEETIRKDPIIGPTVQFMKKRRTNKALENPCIKNPGLRYPKSILYFPVPARTDRVHPTQKPLGLLEFLVETYSNKNDIVLDFVIGSGTTAVAALKLGRCFYGCDISPEYVKLANERVEKAKLKMAQLSFLKEEGVRNG